MLIKMVDLVASPHEQAGTIGVGWLAPEQVFLRRRKSMMSPTQSKRSAAIASSCVNPNMAISGMVLGCREQCRQPVWLGKGVGLQQRDEGRGRNERGTVVGCSATNILAE
jgi:hypothetical protein